MQSKENELGTRPVGRLLFSLALPAITAQVVNVLYNMVDRMYIGHIPVVGATALTGLGVTEHEGAASRCIRRHGLAIEALQHAPEAVLRMAVVKPDLP